MSYTQQLLVLIHFFLKWGALQSVECLTYLCAVRQHLFPMFLNISVVSGIVTLLMGIFFTYVYSLWGISHYLANHTQSSHVHPTCSLSPNKSKERRKTKVQFVLPIYSLTYAQIPGIQLHIENETFCICTPTRIHKWWRAALQYLYHNLNTQKSYRQVHLFSVSFRPAWFTKTVKRKR